MRIKEKDRKRFRYRNRYRVIVTWRFRDIGGTMSHVFYYNMKIFLYLQCFTHLYLILIWVWIMWKTRFCEPLNYWLTLLFDTHILKTAGGPAASAPYHNSPIFSVPTLLKLNSSIRSYTLLYRILAFRHIKYWKILYRCSGTFRQK